MPHVIASAWRSRTAGQLRWLRTETVRTWSHSGVRRGLLATSLIAIGGFSRAFTPENSPWLDALPWLETSASWQLVASVLSVLGTLMLIDAWFQLRPRIGRAHPDLRIVIALWTLPMLLGPPIFSQDSYALAAEGWMLHNNADPYTLGVGMMPGEFAEQAVLVWRYTIAPYGPISLQISELVVGLFNYNPYWSATLGMRLVSLAGVALIAGCTPAIARHFGKDPQTAVWFAAVNPLTITHLIGGAHNDAWMLGLVVLALWLAVKHRFLLACACVAAATAIKLPAVVVAVPVALIAFPPPTTGRRWHREFAAILHVSVASALSLAAFLAISMASGLGWGWIAGLSVPGIVVTMAPWRATGELLGLIMNQFGFYDIGRRMGRIFTDTGIAVTIIAILALFRRWLLRKPNNFGAAAMALIALGGPSLHPWYFTWGLTLFPFSDPTPMLRRLTYLAITLGMYASVVLLCYFNGALAIGLIAFIPFCWLAWVNDRIHVRGTELKQPVPVGNPVA